MEGPPAAKKARIWADGAAAPTAAHKPPAPRSFVRPGKLARYVDAQKKLSHVTVSSTAVGRKRVSAETAELPLSVSPLKHGLTSIFSQRKRRLQRALLKLRVPRTPATPGDRDEGLVALPTDLLMRVVCTLKHCELPPLFTVCKRLHDAATAAMALHFNFLTPARGKQDGEPLPWDPLSPAAVAANVDEEAPPAPRRRGPRRRRPKHGRDGAAGLPPRPRSSHRGEGVDAEQRKHKMARDVDRERRERERKEERERREAHLEATVKSLHFASSPPASPRPSQAEAEGCA
mmetsp:Transcript_46296/g.148250  ORF Transcript_46296/g.148250 Transcript_46296/m.148250 type:complete len:289 (+) Transcript_46296:142-1008(+)